MTLPLTAASLDQEPIQVPDTQRISPIASLNRRDFLGCAGGIAAAATGAGALGSLPSPVAAGAARSRAAARNQLAGAARADEALAIRIGAARQQRAHPVPAHAGNGDEAAYAARLGNFTKGLPHTALGEVDPAAYNALLAALAHGASAGFEALPMGGAARFADPMAAYAFVLEGADPFCLATPPPPAFSSAGTAAEMAELYWLALARDIPYAAYATDPLIGRAAADLTRLAGFGGPRANGVVNRASIFRVGLPGELTGPYLSQFLWWPIPYGAMPVPQRYPVAPAQAYMSTFADWLTVQRGQYHPPTPSTAANRPSTRYLSTGRDLTTYLHADFPYQAYLNAGLILYQMAVPLDAGNPYLHARNQTGAATFGPQHLYDLVARAANAALKACWYQKWLVHRRLRPEEFGGRVQKRKMGLVDAPIHTDLLATSTVLDAVEGWLGSYLLPMPYPEGAPMHPSYPAAHSTIAGACVTMLKAFFDETAPVHNPVVTGADGSLIPYTGAPLAVGGELNKLAGNVAMGRGFGGVHWRSDNLAGLQLGEAVAIGILADEAETYPERFTGFSLTTFDGTTITA